MSDYWPSKQDKVEPRPKEKNGVFRPCELKRWDGNCAGCMSPDRENCRAESMSHPPQSHPLSPILPQGDEELASQQDLQFTIPDLDHVG